MRHNPLSWRTLKIGIAYEGVVRCMSPAESAPRNGNEFINESLMFASVLMSDSLEVYSTFDPKIVSGGGRWREMVVSPL